MQASLSNRKSETPESHQNEWSLDSTEQDNPEKKTEIKRF
jgi:hypothetical protein